MRKEERRKATLVYHIIFQNWVCGKRVVSKVVPFRVILADVLTSASFHFYHNIL